MTKAEVLSIIHFMAARKFQCKEIWALLLAPLTRAFNEGTLDLRELNHLATDLRIIKLQSPKLFQIIVDYFLKNRFDEKSLT